MTDKEAYTSETAARDLSAMTHLTINEAVELLWPLESRLTIDLADAFPKLKLMAQYLVTPIGNRGAGSFSDALVNLIELCKDDV